MARSVVNRPVARCEQCRLSARWCICESLEHLVSPVRVDVLMHRNEWHKPTSTGRLLHRLVQDSRCLLAGPDLAPAALCPDPGRELWLLHPSGEDLPEDSDPTCVQVMLLDGSWKQASRMLQSSPVPARRVRLRMEGESRYWLRTQQDGGRFSTLEAFTYLLRHFGFEALATRLDSHLELHVYAGLRQRGQIAEARRYLESSKVLGQWAGLIEQLQVRRPLISFDRADSGFKE